jgi:ABC-type sugar transport system ATPase subunit
MAGIEIRGLSRHFRDGTRALDGIDLEVAPGELMVLVGPSGSGKTTLLRLLAGLDQPTVGTMCLDGKDLAGVPPHRRNVALVFQNLALYGHLSVRDNLAFGLQHEGGQRVTETAKLLGIEHLLSRFPAELSGGEQQRVALGRAIVRQPAALLLDEPLSSLDGPTRRDLRRELKRLQRQLGVPTIYVTHDQAEAMALGDRIAVLDRGRLQQVASPHDVYHRPANQFVANFFGPQGMNFVEIPSSILKIERNNAICGFRPEDATITDGNAAGTRGIVETCEQLGDTSYVHVRLEEQLVTIKLPHNATPPRINDRIPITIDPNRVHWFDTMTGNRLTDHRPPTPGFRGPDHEPR